MDYLITKEIDGLLTLRLNRPDKHNAFNPKMIAELQELFEAVERRGELRAVWLEGEGKSFCAGGDLDWMRSMVGFTEQQNLNDAQNLFDMFETMARCTLPLLGYVHGNVFGGGLGLLAVCDIVAAEASTRFCFSEARMGIAPAVISPFILRKANLGLIREPMLSARVFNCSEAKASGLLHFYGSEADSRAHLEASLTAIKECAPGAIRAGKRLLNDLERHSWKDYRDMTSRLIAARRVSPEGQEGLKAFLEKREPSWRTPKA